MTIISPAPDANPAGTASVTESVAATAPRFKTTLDRELLAIAGVVVLGVLMAVLDTTVVNVALNTLSRDFDAPLTTIQWVTTGYTLALAMVIPLTAWMAHRFGSKRVYVTSIALFVVGSALAGLAWNAPSLILFRVLQGLGGGMLMPIGMTILTAAAGPRRVGRVMSLFGIPVMLGPIFGPMLGGWMVDSFTWRWIFYINVPLGVVAWLLAVKVLKPDVKKAREPLDYLGFALLSPGLALVIFGLAQLGAKGGLAHVDVTPPAVVGAVMLALFIRHALRVDKPLLDLRLFASKVFSATAMTLVLIIIAVFGGMLLLPLYLQIVRGEGALDTGLLLAPQGLGTLIAMPIAGRLSDRTGPGKIIPGGLALVAVCFWWLTRLADDTPLTHICVVIFVMGLGLGLTIMPAFTGALQTLTGDAIADGNTLLNINQQVAASVGTSAMVVILTTYLSNNLGSSGADNISELSALSPAEYASARPAIAAAFASTFWWAMGLVLVALMLSILLPKKTPDIDGHSPDMPRAMLH